jgi:hypothetical protein
MILKCYADYRKEITERVRGTVKSELNGLNARIWVILLTCLLKLFHTESRTYGCMTPKEDNERWQSRILNISAGAELCEILGAMQISGYRSEVTGAITSSLHIALKCKTVLLVIGISKINITFV